MRTCHECCNHQHQDARTPGIGHWIQEEELVSACSGVALWKASAAAVARLWHELHKNPRRSLKTIVSDSLHMYFVAMRLALRVAAVEAPRMGAPAPVLQYAQLPSCERCWGPGKLPKHFVSTLKCAPDYATPLHEPPQSELRTWPLSGVVDPPLNATPPTGQLAWVRSDSVLTPERERRCAIVSALMAEIVHSASALVSLQQLRPRESRDGLDQGPNAA